MAPLIALNLGNAPPEWSLAQPVYVEVLKDLPADILQAAVMEHIATSEWFPKPAQIRALATERMEHRRAELRYWQEQKVDMEAPIEPPPTEEQKASVDALMAAQFGEKRAVERRSRPPPEEVTEAIKRVANGLRAFRLPDENDPVVREWLRER